MGKSSSKQAWLSSRTRETRPFPLGHEGMDVSRCSSLTWGHPWQFGATVSLVHRFRGPTRPARLRLRPGGWLQSLCFLPGVPEILLWDKAVEITSTKITEKILFRKGGKCVKGIANVRYFASAPNLYIDPSFSLSVHPSSNHLLLPAPGPILKVYNKHIRPMRLREAEMEKRGPRCEAAYGPSRQMDRWTSRDD